MFISRKKYEAIITDYQKRINNLNEEIARLNTAQQSLLDKYGKIIDTEAEYARIQKSFSEEVKNHEEQIEALLSKEKSLSSEYNSALAIYDELKKAINLYDSQIDLIEYGLYEPIFNFDTPDEFKIQIKDIQEKQKALISEQKAAICATQWTVNGSSAQGRKMVNKEIKLILRAFNGECDAIISKVRWNNAQRCKEKITDIYTRLNKLGNTQLVSITEEYLFFKLEELDLYHGLESLNYSIKEQQKALRESQREEEKAQKELEQERVRAEKEEIHYQNALEKIKKEIETATGIQYEQLSEKIKYYEEELAEARANKERAISMAQQTRRGYVYIISNIGSFGENVYKIGMTRRLDPEDRIRELSNASVPFRFDIHAMIYSEDAPALETMLHNTFDKQKVNLINGRKDFFRVPIEEIQEKIKDSGISARFIKNAEARDYRESLRIRNTEVLENTKQQDFPDCLFSRGENYDDV